MKKLLALLLFAVPAFADIAVTPGSGKTVQTDTVNAKEIQFVKIVNGTLGSSATIPSGTTGLNVEAYINTSSNTVTANAGTGTFNIQPNATVFVVNAPTVTFNGVAQPVTVGNAVGTYNIGSSTVSFLVAQNIKVNDSGGTGINSAGANSLTGLAVYVTNPTSGPITNSAIPTYGVGVTTMNVTTSIPVYFVGATTVTFPSAQAVTVNSLSAYQAAFPANGTAVGFFNPYRNAMWPLKVDESSTTYVYITSGTLTGALPAGTNSIGAITVGTSIPTYGVGITTMNVTTSIPTYGVGITTMNVTTAIPTYGVGVSTVAQSGNWNMRTQDGAGNAIGSAGGSTLTGLAVYHINVDTAVVTTSIPTYGVGITTMNVTTSIPTYGVGITTMNVTTSIPVFGVGITTFNVTTSIPVYGVGISTFTGTLSTNGAANTTNRMGTLPGIARNGFGIPAQTAYTVGRDASELILSSSGLLGVSIQSDNTLATFAASTNVFTVNSASGDIMGICGNAANVVEVTGADLSCTQTTAGVIPITVAKRSSAYTLYWSTITATPMDSGFQASPTIAFYQTPGFPLTNGTLVSYVDSMRIGAMATGTAADNGLYIFNPMQLFGSYVYLRGTGQCLGINIQNTAASGLTCSGGWFWKEVSSP